VTDFQGLVGIRRPMLCVLELRPRVQHDFQKTSAQRHILCVPWRFNRCGQQLSQCCGQRRFVHLASVLIRQDHLVVGKLWQRGYSKTRGDPGQLLVIFEPYPIHNSYARDVMVAAEEDVVVQVRIKCRLLSREDPHASHHPPKCGGRPRGR
jgi:hypothetical protein